MLSRAGRFAGAPARAAAGLARPRAVRAPAVAVRRFHAARAARSDAGAKSGATKAAAEAAEPKQKAKDKYEPTALDTVADFVFDNPGRIIGGLLAVFMGYVLRSWMDDTERGGHEEALDAERLVSGPEWRDLRALNRLTAAEFSRIVAHCLELFPEGEASPDDFLWVVDAALAELRAEQADLEAEQAADRARASAVEARRGEVAQRELERRRRLAQLRAAEAEEAAERSRAWLRAVTMGLLGGPAPGESGKQGSSLGPGGAPAAHGGGSGASFGADVYADEEEAEAVTEPWTAAAAFPGAAGSPDPAQEPSPSGGGGRSAESLRQALAAWEAALPAMPDPDMAADMAAQLRRAALPPASLRDRHVMERLLVSVATGQRRGDAGAVDGAGLPSAPQPAGILLPVMRLVRRAESLLRGTGPDQSNGAAVGVDTSAARRDTLPLPLLLTALLNLVDEGADGRMDLLLALHADTHPLLAGPAAAVALPAGYAAAQVDFRRRARSLGFAGTFRGDASDDVRSVAPETRAAVDGVEADAAAAAADAAHAADAAAAAGADAADAAPAAAAAVARASVFENAEAAAERLKLRDSPTDPAAPPRRPPVCPAVLRQRDVTSAIAALQATWQLSPVGGVQRARSWPVPEWRRRDAAASISAACAAQSIKPLPAPGTGDAALSRADAMRLVWSDDVCPWGECRHVRGPIMAAVSD
ncbi:hypothetical protein FNF29_02607 [Cafeteria roenbergensis]|uniref:Uncharacterized protein n=1 Tax=Cafeteria roenbergensis TaxID=33653 RepID=A0A5A8CPG0_CAFRO|nr:hypothetical protein FNF29_02607 [Cafeteria roenbergensis]|eukprot:KAA0154387.1 hypothetical protein FNF29_02607 [Cafeteria roenbergensis]